MILMIRNFSIMRYKILIERGAIYVYCKGYWIKTIRKAPHAECARKTCFWICLRSLNKTLLIYYHANEEILNLSIFGHKQGFYDPFRDLNIV